MATLTLQVRLGISRGWRVRTLNNVKFYNQAIAHCLFIFSTLRARGYKDRIWTLNYSVFMSGDRYSIYVEYFLLPDHSGWKRGIQRTLTNVFTTERPLISGIVRPALGRAFTFKSAPHVSKVANIRRTSRKKGVNSVNNAIWFWAAKSRILDVLLRNYRIAATAEAPAAGMLGLASSVADGVLISNNSPVPPTTPHYLAKKYTYNTPKLIVTLNKVAGSQAHGELFVKARRRRLVFYFGKYNDFGQRVLPVVKKYRSMLFGKRSSLGDAVTKDVYRRSMARVKSFIATCAVRRLLWAGKPSTSNSVVGALSGGYKLPSALAKRYVRTAAGSLRKQALLKTGGRALLGLRNPAERYKFWYFNYQNVGDTLDPKRKGWIIRGGKSVRASSAFGRKYVSFSTKYHKIAAHLRKLRLLANTKKRSSNGGRAKKRY